MSAQLVSDIHVSCWEIRDRKQIKRQNMQKLNTTQNTAKQNYPGSVASYIMTLGQETRWAYSTTLPSLHRAERSQVQRCTTKPAIDGWTDQ